MQTATHDNRRGLNDLYILPESHAEHDKIRWFLKLHDIDWHYSFADVEGHEWFNRLFIEVPFGEKWIDLLTASVEGEAQS